MPKTPKSPPPESKALRQSADVLANPPGQEQLLAEYKALAESLRKLEHKLYKTLTISDSYQRQVKDLAVELERASASLRQLREVAWPICVYCRKVRSDDDYWQRLETFMTRNVDVMFSQGICPDCVKATRDGLGPPAKSVDAKALPAFRKARRHVQTALEDASVGEIESLAGKVALENPALGQELAAFATRYAKLSRRFNKTLTISDSYQSQLRDLNMRLELMARTDLLTGLANRWEMTHRLEAERSRTQRHASTFSLIIGDMDHFKAVNDTHGHMAGDSVLRHVAAALAGSLRAEDLCARWGGEEFLVLLPETALPQAAVVAEKLRAVVHRLGLTWEGAALAVTISLGVAEYTPGTDVGLCIKQADDALYAAKEAGRDQVAVAARAGTAPAER